MNYRSDIQDNEVKLKASFKSLSMFPRPNRFYGFSVPEQIKVLQEERNAWYNSRLDLMLGF